MLTCLLLCLSLGMPAAFAANINLQANLQLLDKPDNSGVIHTLVIICDQYESPENNLIAASVRVDLATVTRLIDVLRTRAIGTVKSTVLQGKQASLTGIRTALNKIAPGTNDVIFVYFSGHGAIDRKRTYFLTSDERALYRDEVERILNAKQARLKILISDACSNSLENMVVARTMNNSKVDIEAGKYDEIYRKLFMAYKGTLNVSSSSEGEFAWSNEQFGGFFTHYFIREGLLKKPVDDWKTIFEDAKTKTMGMYNRFDARERSELAKSGVKGQTARAISLPVLNGTANTNTKTTTNTTTKPAPVVVTPSVSTATIKLENRTKYSVSYYIDRNTSDKNWSSTKLEWKKLEPQKSISYNTDGLIIGFKGGNEDYYYELETGFYTFEYDSKYQLDLFVQSSKPTNTRRAAAAGLQGNWAYNDNDGNSVKVNFGNSNLYTETYADGEVIKGAWALKTEKVGQNERQLLSLSFGSVRYEYLAIQDNNAGELQLTLVAYYEHGEERDMSELQETPFGAIVMYQK
jgi:hypothetical protein